MGHFLTLESSLGLELNPVERIDRRGHILQRVLLN